MGIINILSEEVSQLISAGEVVERPLSVVKELVENAIDAGASRIEIKIKNGGKSFISVKDDGAGMDREDLEKCLKKYATSKISNKDDLFNIMTLGFRGEALYSISAVSKIRIYTRRSNDLRGWYLYADAGEIKEIREGSAEKGTLIEVEDLFFNIPARKKFLKSDGWERQIIVRFIEELSLLYPDKTFILNSENKDILILNGVSSVYKRIVSLFPSLHNNIIYHREENPPLACNLFISKSDNNVPEFYVYSVNGRVVKERVIGRVIKDIFEKQSKKPSFVFLDFNLPPYEVDVNVHPSKREIKFRNNEKVYGFLRESIEKLLKGESHSEKMIDSTLNKEQSGFYIKERSNDYRISDNSLFRDSRQRLFDKEDDFFEDSIKILGIFADCFILIEKDNELIIIDQHALHERIIYNKLIESENNNKTSKKMFLPYIFNVSESLRIYLEEKRTDFEKIGFIYQEMGPKTYALTDIPAVLDYDNAVSAFSELVKDEDLIRFKKDVSKDLIAMLACKSAVKKGDILDIREVKKIIKEYDENNFESFCPHGRNFIVKITLSDMEKMFGRKK